MGAVWAKSGHLAQHYYHMLLARLGMGEGEKANTGAGSQSLAKALEVTFFPDPPFRIPLWGTAIFRSPPVWNRFAESFSDHRSWSAKVHNMLQALSSFIVFSFLVIVFSVISFVFSCFIF